MKRYVRSSGELFFTNELDAVYDALKRMQLNDGDNYMGVDLVYKPRRGIRVEIEKIIPDESNPKRSETFSITYYIYFDDNGRLTMVSQDDVTRKFIDGQAVADFFYDYWNESGVRVSVKSSKRISRRRVMASEMPTGTVTVTYSIDRIKDIRWFKVSDEVKRDSRSKNLFGYYINCKITVSGNITRIQGLTFDEPCDIKFDMDIRSILLKADVLRDIDVDDRGNIASRDVERILRNAGIVDIELVSEYGFDHNVLKDVELGVEFEGDFDLRARNQMKDIIIGG